MGNFNFEETFIKNLFLIKPKKFIDNRGYFYESYNENDFKSVGINEKFVQVNESMSIKGVLRGLHFQINHPQGKLVRCIQGEVFDVAVDLRKNSPTFGRWFGAYLSESNLQALYVPKNFAHGFYVLSNRARFEYLVTDFFHPNDCGFILWNDEEIGIEWPIENDLVILSKNDENAPKFCSLFK